MELTHIFVLIITIPFAVILTIGLIKKRGWDNYQDGLVKYYLAHNRNVFSAYVYFFKAALRKKIKS